MINFLAVCPTYGRPRHLIETTIELFLRQTHQQKYLIIFDDCGNIEEESGDNWHIVSSKERSPNMSSKYNTMLDNYTGSYDAVAVWDDDDLYLPRHLEAHAAMLETNKFSHPSSVWSTYTGKPMLEKSGGRFYASCAVRREHLETLGRWPETEQANFDQLFLKRFSKESVGDPVSYCDPQFVFRWNDTGATHAQHVIKAPNDVEWYGKIKPQCFDTINNLKPQLDSEAEATIMQLENLVHRSTV